MDLKNLAARIPGNPVGRATDSAYFLKVLVDAGLLSPVRPDRLARMLREYVRWGNNPATASTLAAIRHPDAIFVDDELGTLTFAEVEKRANALARALAERGVQEGEGIAIMARNHRGFVDATLASAKLGCSALFLNTMFSGKQLADVVEREGPTALIYDQEFSELLGEVKQDVKRFVCWHDDEGGNGDERVGDLIDETSDAPVSSPS